jgi:exo-beta-1,3-glucanase (GH17 family)
MRAAGCWAAALFLGGCAAPPGPTPAAGPAGAGPAAAFFAYLTGRPGPALVAYSPSELVPAPLRGARNPSAASVRADLEALRPAFDGLVLYAYDRELTPLILAEARRLRYRAVLLGVWDVKSEAELAGTAEAIRRNAKDLALAVVIGNEGVNFNRYKTRDLEAARDRLQALLGADARVPYTTSEPWGQYAQDFFLHFGDFLAPNIHPAFDKEEAGPAEAAAWARARGLDLAAAAGKGTLVKETGLPHGGKARYDPAAQKAFWAAYVKGGRLGRVPDRPGVWVSYAAAFEAFDLPWKAEESGLPVEAFWGLLDPGRKPRPAFGVWKELSRGSP